MCTAVCVGGAVLKGGEAYGPRCRWGTRRACNGGAGGSSRDEGLRLLCRLAVKAQRRRLKGRSTRSLSGRRRAELYRTALRYGSPRTASCTYYLLPYTLTQKGTRTSKRARKQWHIKHTGTTYKQTAYHQWARMVRKLLLYALRETPQRLGGRDLTARELGLQVL